MSLHRLGRRTPVHRGFNISLAVAIANDPVTGLSKVVARGKQSVRGATHGVLIRVSMSAAVTGLVGCVAKAPVTIQRPPIEQTAVPVKLRRPADSAKRCLPQRVARQNVLLVAQYGGYGINLPYNLRGAEHGSRLVNVAGDPGRSVVIFLSAYEATVWDLSRVPRARIRGIVVSGFYAQGLIGVADNVPISMRHRAAFNAYDPFAAVSACPEYKFSYQGSGVREAARLIRAALGSFPSEFFGSYASDYFDISSDGIIPPRQPYSGSLIAEDPPTDCTRANLSVLSVCPDKPDGRRPEYDATYQAHHARWRRDGKLISEAPGAREHEGWAIGPLTDFD